MFDIPIFQASVHMCTDPSQWLSDGVATAGLILRVRGCSNPNEAAWRVAAWIGAAYWFTASTSFANPATTIVRSLSNTCLRTRGRAIGVQGDVGALPWIGRRTGRSAISDFIRDLRALTEPVSFDVEDILASDGRAAIVGSLKTRIKASDRIIASQFAIILTIVGDGVTRFQMLEDTFDVSKAARN
jgi:hypothetical protein